MAGLGNQPGVEAHGRHEFCTSTFEKMPGNGFPSTLFCDPNLFKGPMRLNLRRCQIDSLERGNDRVRVEKLSSKVEVLMSAMTTFSALKMRKCAVSLRKLRLVSRRRTWPDCEISQRSRRTADTHFVINLWISN